MPITDAQSLVFDDSLLFDINKFSGWDQIETGTRVNYGLQYTMQTANGISFRTVAGESIQMAGPNAFAAYANNGDGKRSILRQRASECPLGLRAGSLCRLQEHVQATVQLRFNEKDLTLDDQRYTLQAKLGFLQAGVAFEAAPALPYFALGARQEVSGFGALKLTENGLSMAMCGTISKLGSSFANSMACNTQTSASSMVSHPADEHHVPGYQARYGHCI